MKTAKSDVALTETFLRDGEKVPGSKLEKIEDKASGTSGEIRLTKDMRFVGHAHGAYVIHETADVVRDWVRRRLANARTRIDWKPVISIEVQAPRTGYDNADGEEWSTDREADAIEAEAKFKVERFYVAKLENGDWATISWADGARYAAGETLERYSVTTIHGDERTLIESGLPATDRKIRSYSHMETGIFEYSESAWQSLTNLAATIRNLRAPLLNVLRGGALEQAPQRAGDLNDSLRNATVEAWVKHPPARKAKVGR